MALIICPECEREISDKTNSCPHCGYPLMTSVIAEQTAEVDQGSATSDEENNVAKPKNKKLLMGAIAGVVLGALVIVGVVYGVTVLKPQKTYNEALLLLESGKYEAANELFQEIPDYKDVTTLQEQLKYESRVYECVSAVKEQLKNPDSLQIYAVNFYESSDESNPICVMEFGGQNGFGGTTTSYGYFMYSEEAQKYEYMASCNTLDKDDYDVDDLDEIDWVICSFINVLKDGDYEVGNIDLARVKNIVKNESFSTIKIVK